MVIFQFAMLNYQRVIYKWLVLHRCVVCLQHKNSSWIGISHRHPSFSLEIWHSSMVNLRESDQFQRLVLENHASTEKNVSVKPAPFFHISNFGQSNPVKSTFPMDPNTGKVRLTPESRHHTPVVPVVICSKVVPPPVINCLCSPMN